MAGEGAKRGKRGEGEQRVSEGGSSPVSKKAKP